ncbi:MAG TPA: hydrophobe/amphiphile efflux-1 family RND transporter, partial [Thermodesulfobacterium commune]|nr:hydrophobe/amphiphile efflux-1 family RND transporter [Thermodesulfobacterium commune]
LVLSAVFIPAAFLGGFTGAFYRQFAVTIAISMILSGIVALTLTPALCARFLEEEHKKMSLPIRLFNLFFFKSRKWFVNTVKNFLRFVPIGIAVFIFVVIGTIFFIKRLPTGLVPFEDNGLL